MRFSNATHNVSESSTSVRVTVIRGGSTGSTVTVNVKTTGTGTAEGGPSPCGPGIDFTTAATLPARTFSPGQDEQERDDPVVPGHRGGRAGRAIGLALDNIRQGATLGTPNTATIQIAENDVAGGRHSSPPPRAA